MKFAFNSNRLGRSGLARNQEPNAIHPFADRDELVQVRANLVTQSKSLIIMRAEAKTKAGKLVTTSHQQLISINCWTSTASSGISSIKNKVSN